MEHRWGDRRPVILRVRLDGPSQISASGWLMDVSISGAYVRTMAALATMSRINIEMDEHNSGHPGLGQLRLQGRVVRLAPMGIGVEWEEFASGTLGELVEIATSFHRHRVHHTHKGAQGPGLWAPGTCGTSDQRSCGIEP